MSWWVKLVPVTDFVEGIGEGVEGGYEEGSREKRPVVGSAHVVAMRGFARDVLLRVRDLEGLAKVREVGLYVDYRVG